MTFLAEPAHAGHWVWTVSGSGEADTNGTANQHTWNAPTTPITITGNTTIISVPQVASGEAVGPTFSGSPIPIVANANLSVTVTGAWTNDTNSDNTTPPGVLFSVNSSARGEYNNSGGPILPGKADDGFGDPVSQSGSSTQIGTSQTPPAKFVPSQSGSVSIALKLSASATGTPGYFQGGGSAGASVGPVTIGIHAQPYNFHQTQVMDNGNGTLTFTYFWLSTDGNLSDLDPSCLVHEYVTYQGGSPYVPPAPFTVTTPDGRPAGLANPTISPSPKLPGSVGILTDNQLFGGTNPLNAAPPYQLQTFTGTQTYEFDDSATGQVNQPIPGPDAGPLSITRNIGPRPPYTPYWWYSVTKNGTTAWASLGN